MNPFVYILILILPAAAFLIGTVVARSNNGTLSRAERKELGKARNLIHALDLKASEHMAYGDTFATIASGMIHDHRKELT